MKTIKQVKTPDDCSSLADLRLEIDQIDRSIINLMSERLAFVKEVVKYRDQSKKAEYDNSRYLAVLEERAQWARDSGLDGQAIKAVFKLLIDYYIKEQKQIANKK
jgi:isochorismate pyruvate lyase